jgi:hypothetical protein
VSDARNGHEAHSLTKGTGDPNALVARFFARPE